MWSLSSPSQIPWHRRLEARVLFGVVAVVLLSLFAVLFAARQRVTANSMKRSRSDLVAARAAFRHLIRDRADFSSAQSRLITELPIFRALLSSPDAARDAATVSGMALHYRDRLKADFCLVTDETGRRTGDAGVPRGGNLPSDMAEGIKSALKGKPSQTLSFLGGALYLVVTEPALFGEDEVLGTLTSGYRLGDATARDLSGVTRCEVNFVSGSRLCGSSLNSRPVRAGLDRSLPVLTRSLSNKPAFVSIGGRSYVGGLFPLTDRNGEGETDRLLLLQDWDPTRSFLSAVDRGLFAVGALALLCALGGGWVFSRRVALPLREISEAAQEIAGGEWDRQAPVTGSVEARILAESFNRMTAHLRHYYHEARSRSEQLEDALERLHASYTDTLSALSRALDARDNETEGHSLRVADYAVRIARRMGLGDAEVEELKLGALLHDVGKIGVPDAILRKPGRLTEEEWAVMRRHCEFGLEIVRDIPHLSRAADLIRYHHERFDGGGYPHGLWGGEIPLAARIFSVADTLDAMTSDRPYRKGRTFGEALEEIRRCSGTQFDPQVVRALMDLSLSDGAISGLPRLSNSSDHRSHLPLAGSKPA
jgi:putative nucleotidyltransferase with HDIG domain